MKLSVVLLYLSVLSVQALSAVFTDDFSDNLMDDSWTIYYVVYDCSESDVALDEIDQHLQFTASLPEPVDQEEGNMGAVFYCSDTWWLDINYDFSFKINFHHIKTSEAAELILGISPSDVEDIDPWIFVSAECWYGDRYFYYGNYVDADTFDWDETTRSTNDGTLYISYNSSADELYLSYTGYGAAKAWKTVRGTLKGQWGGLPIHVCFGGAAYYGTSVNASQMYLDNFVLDTGTTTAPGYNLNLTKTGSGTVEIDGTSQTLPWTGTYTPDSEITLEAIPQTGSVFVYWSGDLSYSDNPITFTLENNTDVNAYFTTCSNLSLVSEYFETADFTQYPWIFSGDADWTAVDFEGSYAARSGTVSDSQQSSLHLTCAIQVPSLLSFFRKVSSEEDYDFLYFYIDGELIDAWSGSTDWDNFAYEISPGLHVLGWVYEKDSINSAGSDCAWIDDIILAPYENSFIEMKNPDFDGDGKSDLLWERLSTGANYITLMNGGVRGAFQYIKDSKNTDLTIVGTGDFNGDTKADLLWERSSTGANYITLMDGVIHGPLLYIPDSKDTDLTIVGTGDFDGDTQTDLLWERVSTGANYITLMNSGTRGVFQYILDSKDADLEIVGTGDFNGDAKSDLLWERVSTGANYITLMNNGLRGAFQYILSSKDTDLAIAGIGDFDGDTKSDLLWERLSTGANYITLMDGGTRGAFQYIFDSKNTDLVITGIGDFDGDTKSDLLWERLSTGANYITLMNGGTRGVFQYILDSKDSDLEITAP